jgi:hypothetical protein
VARLDLLALELPPHVLDLLRVHHELGRVLAELVGDEIEHGHGREHGGRREVHLEHRPTVGQHHRLPVAQPQLRIACSLAAEEEVLLVIVRVEDTMANRAVEGSVMLHEHYVEHLHHRS